MLEKERKGCVLEIMLSLVDFVYDFVSLSLCPSLSRPRGWMEAKIIFREKKKRPKEKKTRFNLTALSFDPRLLLEARE